MSPAFLFFAVMVALGICGGMVAKRWHEIDRRQRAYERDLGSVDDFALWSREMGRTAAYPPGRAQ